MAVRDVGFSGHKDRHAVTRQAYTLPWPALFDVDPCLEWQGEGYAVRAAHRHGRKLRPGSHRANRFELRVRDLRGDRGAIEACLAAIREHGVPNYFGPQRFGRDGSNLRRALAWAGGDVRAAGPRRSAASRCRRPAATCSTRCWPRGSRAATGTGCCRARPSCSTAGAASSSQSPIDAALEARRVAMDVHPSGPLPGRGESPATGVAREVEDSVVAPHAALVALLAAERIEHERRSLRLPVREFDWTFGDDDYAGPAVRAAAGHVRHRRAARSAGRRLGCGRRRGGVSRALLPARQQDVDRAGAAVDGPRGCERRDVSTMRSQWLTTSFSTGPPGPERGPCRE